MHITLDSLRVLDAIDRNNSFSSAAKELNRVPSAVTYAIKQLEMDLGVPLFDRSGYRAQLTPAGKELLKGGRSLLDQVQALEQSIKISAGLALPNLTISYDDALNLDGIHEVLGDFFKDFPEISVNLSAEILNGCSDALLYGAADLVVGFFSELPTSDLYHYEAFGEIPFVFAIAPTHPLAKVDEPLALQEITAHRIVAIPDTAKTIPKASSGYAPDRQFLSVPSMDSKIKAQIAGLGVGFVPLSRAKPYLESGLLIQKEVDRPKTSGRCYLAWKVDRVKPPLECMITLLRENKQRLVA